MCAVVLRTGVGGESVLSVAQRLLVRFGGLPGLARAGTPELVSEHGIGEAKVAQLKAAFELGRRLLVTSPAERPQVRSPADAAQLLMGEMSLLDQEHLRLILLDTKNHVLSIPTVYVGSLNTSLIRVGELFRYALKENCAALIVVHNHPSGDPAPSPVIWRIRECQMVEAKAVDSVDNATRCPQCPQPYGDGFSATH